MNIIKFILYVQCIPKGKRKHSVARYELAPILKSIFDIEKEKLTKEAINECSINIDKLQDNKSIKDVKSAWLIVREVEETTDDLGTFETYMPHNDVKITII